MGIFFGLVEGSFDIDVVLQEVAVDEFLGVLPSG